MIGWWSKPSKGSKAIIAYEITFVILSMKEIYSMVVVMQSTVERSID